MRFVAISFKQCWQDKNGGWFSTGGFPLQMNAIASLFQNATILITETKPKSGGIQFDPSIHVVPMRSPTGSDFKRKMNLLANIFYYLKIMIPAIQSADVVHTPLPGDLAFMGMILALVMRKKLIARYGGSWVRNNRNTFVNDVIRLMMRIFAGGKNVMLVSGVDDKPPGKKIHWLFSTAVSRSELGKYQPNLNRGLSVPALLVFIGRLSPEKGVDRLIQALRLLKDRKFQPMPNLVILGDGPENERLNKLSHLMGLDQTILFAGMVNRDVLSNYLLKADLCVQVTLTEGLSKAWLDAFAFGVPVIVGNVGAAAAAVGKNNKRGWIVKAGDPDVLADCIQQILTSKINWPVVRQQCRQYAESKTLEDWSNQIGQICADQWQIQLVEGKLIA